MGDLRRGIELANNSQQRGLKKQCAQILENMKVCLSTLLLLLSSCSNTAKRRNCTKKGDSLIALLRRAYALRIGKDLLLCKRSFSLPQDQSGRSFAKGAFAKNTRAVRESNGGREEIQTGNEKHN